MNKDPVLIIDDQETNNQLYLQILKESKLDNYKICTTSKDGYSFILKNDILLIILNLDIPNITCIDFVKEIKDIKQQVPLIVISKNKDVNIAVECMKVGVFDFINELDKDALINSINKAKETAPVEKEEEIQPRRIFNGKELKNPEVFSSIITDNDTMKSIFKYIEAIANSPKAVLITGESGTGKELIAKAIHDISRKNKKFVAINVAGLDDTIFSDTLFGHKKGAFTGAEESRKGLIEQAAEGTLFLDEIGDLDNNSQVKLLRLLQEDEYYPLGSDIPEKAVVRVITSTNADLEYKQERGIFRTDLYYRLNAHHINLPPLRDRLDDLPLLVEHFLKQSVKSLDRKEPVIPKKLYSILRQYFFRGNIRELQSMIYDAVSRTEGNELDIVFINDYIKRHSHDIKRSSTSYIGGDCEVSYSGRFPTLEEIEDFFITEALKKSRGNQSIAAQLLGVAQSTLSRRLKSKFKI